MRLVVVVLALVAISVVVPSATAMQSLELQARVERVEVVGPAELELRAGLFALAGAPGSAIEALQGASFRVEQFWRNDTIVPNPVTGQAVHKHVGDLERRPWTQPIQTLRLLEQRLQDAQLALALEPGAPLRVSTDAPASLAAASEAWSPPRVAVGAAPEQPEFAAPAEGSGRVSLTPGLVEAGHALRLLVDGWVVEVLDASGARSVETGYSSEGTRASYTYLVVTLEGGSTWTGFQWQGLAPAPLLRWTGLVRTEVVSGELLKGTQRQGVSAETLELDGTFRGTIVFPTDAATHGAEFHALGQGDLATARAKAVVARGGPPGGLLAALALGGLGAMAWWWHRRRSPAVPAQVEPRLVQLLEHVRKNPLDAEGHLALGAALLEDGHAEPGLRALDRAFRLHPGSVMRVLEDPNLASLRDHEDVRLLLARIHRDNHRRHWAGYA